MSHVRSLPPYPKPNNHCRLGFVKRCTSHCFLVGLTGTLLTTLVTSPPLLSSHGERHSSRFTSQLATPCLRRYDWVSDMGCIKILLHFTWLKTQLLAGVCLQRWRPPVRKLIIMRAVSIRIHRANVSDERQISYSNAQQCVGISHIAFTLVRLHAHLPFAMLLTFALVLVSPKHKIMPIFIVRGRVCPSGPDTDRVPSQDYSCPTPNRWVTIQSFIALILKGWSWFGCRTRYFFVSLLDSIWNNPGVLQPKQLYRNNWVYLPSLIKRRWGGY
jgi:hypothetical protein